VNVYRVQMTVKYFSTLDDNKLRIEHDNIAKPHEVIH